MRRRSFLPINTAQQACQAASQAIGWCDQFGMRAAAARTLWRAAKERFHAIEAYEANGGRDSGN